MNYVIIISALLSFSFFNSNYGNAPTTRSTKNKIVYIIPPNGYQNEKLFDMSDPIYNRDDCMRPFYVFRECLRSIGYNLKTTTLKPDEKLEHFAGIVVCGVPHDKNVLQRLARIPPEKVILLLLEPPTVVPHYYDRSQHTVFGKIYILLDDWVDNKQYFKLFYPQTTLTMIDPIVPFEQKKFCTMIAGRKKSKHPLSLYNAREEIIHFFENKDPGNFDLYGSTWNQVDFPSYKGRANAKMDILKNYKFCICYENMRDTRGYVTEKIFDVLIAGCVPIYYGASNIAEYVDPACFILRENFQTDEKLYSFLRRITPDEYDTYIEAAKRYLASEQAYYFSTDFFVTTLLKEFVQ